MIFLIWAYPLGIVVPTISNTLGRQGYGKFGYNQRLGKCDYMDDDGNTSSIISYSLGFGLPFLMMIVSYFQIWRKTNKSISALNSSV